jgi:cobalt-zinc-cadmium efflux system protein
MGKNGEIKSRNLIISTFVNFVIVFAEIIGGLLSGSLALLSDALHNLGDGIAIFISYLANRISKKSVTDKKTFGYKRIEIIAALFNAVSLIAITIYLFTEAYKRLQNPEPVKAQLMFIVAVIGLMGNIISVLLLHKDASKNLNVKAAYIHLLGDTFSSVVVILGGLLMYYFDIYWVDPIITILIGLYILREAYRILMETIDILMQATPKDIDINKIKGKIEEISSVANVHHIHVWSLTDKQTHFEGHIATTNDFKISELENIKKQISELLSKDFKINHITLQFEFKECSDSI